METNTATMPRIGDFAPDFEAMTTTGKMKFSEHIKGKWTILFSHPADFTPVCTTEMTGFALEKDFFASKDTLLVGLSIDSNHSPVWARHTYQNPEAAEHSVRPLDAMMHRSCKFVSNTPSLLVGAYFLPGKQFVPFVDPSELQRKLSGLLRCLGGLDMLDELLLFGKLCVKAVQMSRLDRKDVD
jgi:hypothetical protein